MSKEELRLSYHDIKKNLHLVFQLLEIIDESKEVKNPTLNSLLAGCLGKREQINSDLSKFHVLLSTKEEA